MIITAFSLILLLFTGYRTESRRRDSDVHITEICVNNETNAYDDNGEYGADYIELYNSSYDDIDLSGYFLSDGRTYNKFKLDNAIIRAQGTLILWCSPNTDDVLSYDEKYIPRDIHQDVFSLKRGETVVLGRNDSIIESVRIPMNIPGDKVYACLSTDLDTFCIMASSPYTVQDHNDEEPTVNSLNNPVFSIQSGWYPDPFYIELESRDGTIYYTTDGTDPDINSSIYTGKILIYDKSIDENNYVNIGNISLNGSFFFPESKVDKATIVKAVSISENTRSEIVSNTYFVGLDKEKEYENVSVIEITMDPLDLFDYCNGIYQVGNVYDIHKYKYSPSYIDPDYFCSYTNYAKEGLGWERKAQIDYFNKDHKFIFSQNIGIRIHGGWSTAYNQKSFNLYAREIYDGHVNFQVDLFGIANNKLMLRAGGDRDIYSTKMRDVLNQKLVSDRNLGVQNAIPCVLFLNGEFWGLYNLQETIGENYVSENYKVDSDNILIMKNENSNVSGDEAALYDELVSFVSENDISLEENYRYVESQIDIQSYIDYMVSEIYIANCDCLANNLGRWRTLIPEESIYGDCRWRYLLYDTDDSDGMIPGLTDYSVDSFTSGHFEQNPLGENGDLVFSSLIRNDEFKERFVVSFLDIANNNFNYEKVSQIIKEMSDEYKWGTIASQKRFRGSYEIPDYCEIDTFDGIYDEDVFNSDVAIIDAFFKNRFQYIVKYLKKDLKLKGEINEIHINSSDPDHCKVSVNTIPQISENGWVGHYYSDYPIKITCIVDSGYTFDGWFDEDGNLLSEDECYSFNLRENLEIKACLSACE